jgi:hypothetical protein
MGLVQIASTLGNPVTALLVVSPFTLSECFLTCSVDLTARGLTIGSTPYSKKREAPSEDNTVALPSTRFVSLSDEVDPDNTSELREVLQELKVLSEFVNGRLAMLSSRKKKRFVKN